jgi:DNA polymerase (family 10)
VDQLVSEFTQLNPGIDLTVGGSWRRGASVIGDIDLLVISDGPLTATLLEPGAALPSAVDWQRQGPRIANGDMHLPEGPLHVDVWHGYPSSKGAMLVFFTGPMELNIYQRSRAKRMGMALSQNALTDRATGKQLDDGSEEHIYELLAMPYETPEHRQRWVRQR